MIPSHFMTDLMGNPDISKSTFFLAPNWQISIFLTVVVAGVRLKGIQGLDLGVTVSVALGTTDDFLCCVVDLTWRLKQMETVSKVRR